MNARASMWLHPSWIGRSRERSVAPAGAIAVLFVSALTGALTAGAGCAHSRQVAPPPASALPAVEVDSSGVPFAPAPEGLLRPSAVEAIQGSLHQAGFMDPGDRTGRLDPSTRESLRRFQAKNDLPATGLPSYRTIEALHLDSDKVFFSSHRPPAVPTAAKSTDQGSVGATDVTPAP